MVTNLKSGPSLVPRVCDGTNDVNSNAFHSKPCSTKDKAPASLS